MRLKALRVLPAFSINLSKLDFKLMFRWSNDSPSNPINLSKLDFKSYLSNKYGVFSDAYKSIQTGF